MKSLFSILANSLVLFISCQDSSTTKNSNLDSLSSATLVQNTPTPEEQKDTTSTQNYWENMPVRAVAELILKDSIRPVSSPVINSMLDSLSSDSKPSRQFYFKVFNKIMNKADGDIAESIGGYALTYIQNYPKEFLENSRTFSKNQFEAWASNIGIEIFLATSERENVKEAYNQVVNLFNDNCKDCSSYHKSRLKEFNTLVWRTIEENQQAEKAKG